MRPERVEKTAPTRGLRRETLGSQWLMEPFRMSRGGKKLPGSAAERTLIAARAALPFFQRVENAR
jgi:hypothetical protein